MRDTVKVTVDNERVDLRKIMSKIQHSQKEKQSQRCMSSLKNGQKCDKEFLRKFEPDKFSECTPTYRPPFAKKRRNAPSDPRFRRLIEPEKKCSQSQTNLFTPKSEGSCKSSPSEPHIHRRVTRKKEANKYTIKISAPEPEKVKVLERKFDKGKISEIEQTENPPENNPNEQLDLKKYEVETKWKSWTPMFKKKKSSCESSDRHTYKYDDGTEIDSLFIEPKNLDAISKAAFQNKIMFFLFFLGSVCGILLVSLILWLLFDNDIFQNLFKVKEVEDGAIKKTLKLVSGGVLYVIATIVRSIGRILTMPTHQVYQHSNENRAWET